MNFFFGVRSPLLDTQLTIPRFQNRKSTKTEYEVFELRISDGQWTIDRLDDVELNEDFYRIDGSRIYNDSIFCLATQSEVSDFERHGHSRLMNFSSYTDTSPEFRANLQISLKGGGFSSYQSDYPFSMVTKTGSILSPLSSLLAKSADHNILFLKNIYELPVREDFEVFFVNLQTREVVNRTMATTNSLNEIFIESCFVEPEVFLFTDKYIGVPIFCSIKDSHLSLEHTHPPHEYIMGGDKSKVAELKMEFNEIIN